jgi:hypothetical protein
MLGQFVGNLIIVAALRDEYMHLQMRARWAIKSAHCDSGLVTSERIPKQTGTASSAEAAARTFG